MVSRPSTSTYPSAEDIASRNTRRVVSCCDVSSTAVSPFRGFRTDWRLRVVVMERQTVVNTKYLTSSPDNANTNHVSTFSRIGERANGLID